MNSRDLYLIQVWVFNTVIVISYILYGLSVAGFSHEVRLLLDTIQTWIKIYVAVFLILRFNPLRKIKFNDLDAEVAFTAGVFLLTVGTTFDLIKKYAREFQLI